jgi:hypothetical protein
MVANFANRGASSASLTAWPDYELVLTPVFIATDAFMGLNPMTRVFSGIVAATSGAALISAVDYTRRRMFNSHDFLLFIAFPFSPEFHRLVSRLCLEEKTKALILF